MSLDVTARLIGSCVLVMLLFGCDAEGDQTTEPPAEGALIEELEWDAMIPADWRPEALFEDTDLDAISDEDPRAIELMDKLKTLWAEAPVVPELDGRLVKLPGFVVPLDMESEEITELLLVPYYGACIHVPPPPANQTVYVRLPEDKAFAGQAFDTVWVIGTLKVTPTSSDMAEAGYRIDAIEIAPYEGDVEPQ